ncbi:MAG TPA: hypothetical protein VK790_14750 [Solirubrobacteraceae bacterium]|nr:hypothetical protein [Solirubrobacteraceae bacterium]
MKPAKRGALKRRYDEPTVRGRIEALFLDNLGKILTRQQIIEAARDPKTGKDPENWHQRLSELRTHLGYTILTHRDRADLASQEYMMPDASRRATAGARVRPARATWAAVLARAGGKCEWNEAGEKCELADGDIDAVGGGTVKLTADHKQPHSENPAADPLDPNEWQALCGRHQVMKKNYWDSHTGKINAYAVMQAASKKEKREVFDFLLAYFAHEEN